MKFNKFLVLLLIVIWLSAATTYVAYKGYYKEVKINEFNIDINVTTLGAIGFNLDKDAIHFGVVPIGASSKRFINLTNNNKYDTFVYAKKDDSKLSKIVTIKPNYFILGANENKQISLYAHVPEGFELGGYTGKITFIQKVPFYRR